LCDLLLLVASPDATGVMTEHALLVQAKKGIGGNVSLAGHGDLKQRYMYAMWPDFHIAKGDCKGKDDALACKNYSLAATLNIASEGAKGTRYGIVDENAKPAWVIEQGQAGWSPTIKAGATNNTRFDDVSAMSVSANISMGEALEAMVGKSLGHPVQYVGTDDWTDVISGLLSSAMNLHYVNKFHLVKHTNGAPLVPLSAASTFIARNLSTFSLDDFDLELDHFISHNYARPTVFANGSLFSTPPRKPIVESIDNGYGIIRIVVNGHFKDRYDPDRAPKRQAKR